MIRYLQSSKNVTNPYIINDDQHSKFTDIGNDIMSLFIVSILYLSLNWLYSNIILIINKILKSLNVYGKFVWYLYQPF